MTDKFEEPTLPGMSEREVLEAMGPDAIVDHIIDLGETATQIENKMDIASSVLEGAYGLTVEEVLQQRELEETRPLDLSGLFEYGDKNGERT